MKTLLLLALPFLAMQASHADDDDCRFSASRDVEMPTEGIERIIVQAGAGSLKIEGERGRRSLQASGRACASREAMLERLHIRVNREGDTLLLTTEIPEFTINPSSWFGSEARIDLTVIVPAGMNMDVEDASGMTEIAHVGELRVTDASGELRVSNIEGDLSVADDSGSVEIDEVEGSIRVADGSGAISINNIVGEVVVTSDGSGAMGIADVQGNVTIGNDGSGAIRIERVTGSVKIEEDGSGEIYLSDIRHDAAIDHDGSGAIIVENVAGDFTVGESGSGGISHQRVGGNVRVASEEDMEVER